jgi:hypothetical protein
MITWEKVYNICMIIFLIGITIPFIIVCISGAMLLIKVIFGTG